MGVKGHIEFVKSGSDSLDFFNFYWFSLYAFPPVIGDRFVNDGSTVDAFPGIKNQKEVRKTLQHHESFTFRTVHLSLPDV